MRDRISFSRTAIMIVAVVPFVYPFAFLTATGFRTQADYYQNPTGWPRDWTLGHLRTAWSAVDLGQAMINSAIAVTVGVVTTVVLSTMAAFWFTRHSGRLTRILFPSILAVWVLPFVIWSIPFFVLLSNYGATGNRFVLGLVYGTLNAPFGLYLCYAYFKASIPIEVLENAEVDGASALQQFLRIVLPLSLPAVATLAALAFIWNWGDLLVALILIDDPTKFTVTVAAATLVQQLNANLQQTAAVGLVAIVPLIAVFLVAQRAIVRGITAGVGK